MFEYGHTSTPDTKDTRIEETEAACTTKEKKGLSTTVLSEQRLWGRQCSLERIKVVIIPFFFMLMLSTCSTTEFHLTPQKNFSATRKGRGSTYRG